MNKQKRILFLALALVLALSLWSLPAFAEGVVVTDADSPWPDEMMEWGGGYIDDLPEALFLYASQGGIAAEVSEVWASYNEFDPIDAIGVHILAEGAPVTFTADRIEVGVRSGSTTGLLIEVREGGSVLAEVDSLVVESCDDSHAVYIDNQDGSVVVIVHDAKRDTSADYLLRGDGDTALILDCEFPDGGLILGEGVTPENFDVALWKGLPDISFSDSWWENNEEGIAPEELLNYIIRIEQSEGGTIDVEGARERHGFLTAREGEVLIVTGTPEEGWRLVALFNAGEVLTKDENGDYTLTVPKGGGVVVTGLFVQIEAPADWPAVSVEPEDVVARQAMTRVRFLSEDAEPLEAWFFPEQVISVPDAPVREGFRFVCWRTEVGGETVDVAPAGSFQLHGWQDFTAVWEAETA